MNRRILTFIAIGLLSLPMALSASDPTSDDVLVAMGAIKDAAFVACGNFISTKDREIPTIGMESDASTGLPSAVIFDHADLSSFLAYFPEASDTSENGNSLQLLLSRASDPLAPIIRKRLTVHDWKEGEAILDGTCAIKYQTGMTYGKMMSGVLTGTYPKAALAMDMTVSGIRVTVQVHVEGVFILAGDADGNLDITPVEFSVNGKKMET